ncbi:hypothetical protein FQZ97_1143220 [compost metagenome]
MAPTLVAASWPSLNSISVGMPRMPNLAGTSRLSSTFILVTLSLPSYEPATSSRIGAIILQGPHHSAQKSTSTGACASSTSAWKLASDTCLIRSLAMIHPKNVEQGG